MIDFDSCCSQYCFLRRADVISAAFFRWGNVEETNSPMCDRQPGCWMYLQAGGWMGGWVGGKGGEQAASKFTIYRSGGAQLPLPTTAPCPFFEALLSGGQPPLELFRQHVTIRTSIVGLQCQG